MVWSVCVALLIVKETIDPPCQYEGHPRSTSSSLPPTDTHPKGFWYHVNAATLSDTHSLTHSLTHSRSDTRTPPYRSKCLKAGGSKLTHSRHIE